MLVLLAAELGTVWAGAAGWTQFRGPNGSGVGDDVQTPVQFGRDRRAWKTSVPRGLSSPVLAGDNVILTGVEGDRLVTVAYAGADGARRWRAEAPQVPLEPVHPINSPATPTPCVGSDRLYIYFGSYGLLCYDFEGREVWRKPIPTPKSLYGSASSPILHGGHVVLVLDSDADLPNSKLSQSRVLAVNAATGETAWETPRPLLRSGWSTPAIWKLPDGDEIVVLGHGRVCGYDAATGTEKWFVGGFARETIAVPVLGADRAYLASAMGGQADEKPDPEPLWKAMLHFDGNGDGRIARGEITEHFTFPLRPEVPPGHPGFGIPLSDDPARRNRQQEGHFAGLDKDRDGFWTHDEFVKNLGPRPFRPRLVAIRPGGRGEISDTHLTWELNRGIPEIPSPLYHEGRIYLVRNGGVLMAVDAANGRVVYQERLGADGQYTASPVLGRGHLYLISNRGILTVVKAGDRYERVAQVDLGEPCGVTPALAARTLYVRGETSLQAFREP